MATTIEVYLDNFKAAAFEVSAGASKILLMQCKSHKSFRVSYLLEPMEVSRVMVLLVVQSEINATTARLLWI